VIYRWLPRLLEHLFPNFSHRLDPRGVDSLIVKAWHLLLCLLKFTRERIDFRACDYLVTPDHALAVGVWLWMLVLA